MNNEGEGILSTNVTMYLNSGAGIKTPIDMDGTEIKEGDRLTWDYLDGDPRRFAAWMLDPVFVVKYDEKRKFYFANGIRKELYLHDFRFKYCRVVNQTKEAGHD